MDNLGNQNQGKDEDVLNNGNGNHDQNGANSGGEMDLGREGGR